MGVIILFSLIQIIPMAIAFSIGVYIGKRI